MTDDPLAIAEEVLRLMLANIGTWRKAEADRDSYKNEAEIVMQRTVRAEARLRAAEEVVEAAREAEQKWGAARHRDEEDAHGLCSFCGLRAALARYDEEAEK